MAKHTDSSNVKALPALERKPMVLDEAALEAARHSLDKGAVTPSYGPWREDIIKLLNDSLATELVCVLRYKRHHFTADGPGVAEDRRRVPGARERGDGACRPAGQAHRAARRRARLLARFADASAATPTTTIRPT